MSTWTAIALRPGYLQVTRLTQLLGGAEDPASLRKHIVASDGVHVTTLGNNFNFQKLRG